MKSSEVREKLAIIPDDELVEAEEYDDDDFWEALDLLETCRKVVKNIIDRHQDDLTVGRSRIIHNLADDIGVFLSHFIELPDLVDIEEEEE